MCRPTPDSGSSDLVLRLEHCVLCLLIAPMLRNTSTGSLKSSGLRISNVRAPSLTSHSDQPRQTQSLPSLCLQLRLASPTILLQALTGPRITHHTRSPGSVTLGSFMPGGFYAKTNKLAILLDSPNELSQSHQHSRVIMWALLLVIQ